MKTKITILILLITCLGFAQDGVNYKAVIKDDLGNVIANEQIEVEFSILLGGAQTNIYTETHSPITDNNGIVILNIGQGTPTIGEFQAINWGIDSYFLNVKVDIGSGLVDMGTTLFTTVPYALYARDVANKDDADANPTNEIQTLSQTDNTITLSDGGGSFDLPEQKWSSGIGDNVFRLDGRVGIGTSVPSSTLDVQDNSTSGRSLQIHKTDVSSGNDVLEIVVPENAPDNAQFIEMQRGLTGDVVAKVDTDGSATFKSVQVTDDEVSSSDVPEKGRVYSNALPIAYGFLRGVQVNPTIVVDYGIDTVTRNSTGRYSITLDRFIVGTPVIMATLTSLTNTGNTIVADHVGQTIRIDINNSSNQPVNADFSVVIYGSTSN